MARTTTRDTQLRAWIEVQGRAVEYRRRVLIYIEKRGAQGSTDEEGIKATGFNRNTYPPRRTELFHRGLVADSGRRRKTDSGKFAIVWVCANVNRDDQTSLLGVE